MIDTPIRGYFDNVLRTVLQAQGINTEDRSALGGQVAWAGTVFDSADVADTAPWFQPNYIPFEPHAAAIGTAAQNTMSGIYQVDAYGSYTSNATEQDVINLLEPLCAALKRGTQFTTPITATEHVCITCNQSWIFHSSRDTLTARWVVSARVKWNTYLDN